MQRFSYTIPSKEVLTSIFIGKNLLYQDFFVEYLKNFSRKCLILTDTHVYKLHGQSLFTRIKTHSLDAEILQIPEGEQAKCRKIKEDIEDFMLLKGFLRKSLIITLGGGVVNDIGGFVAATYMRSIPFISIPTTLLCAVDASIGGKTSINTPFGKNQIGSFYQPDSIFVDTAVISTCPPKELLNGLAEVIKYALIKNYQLFVKLENSLNLWISHDIAFLKEIIEISQNEKLEIIKLDPEESSVRKILNFGHTIGHAIELASNYSLSHGEAISLGMIAESFMSYKLNYLTKQTFSRILNIFKMFNFPLKLPLNFSKKHFLEAINLDKKNTDQGIGIVILNKIGEVQSFDNSYIQFFKQYEIEKILDWMFLYFKEDTRPWQKF